MRILLVHGWGFGPWMWLRMNERLQLLMEDQPLELVTANLGFRGAEVMPSGSFDLALGHSLGLLWLLESNRVQFDRLVSVNGFTRFCGGPDFPWGWSPKVVQRMRKRLGPDVDGVMHDFRAKCAIPAATVPADDSQSFDVERLDWGLEALIKGDGREQWSRFCGPRRAIAATQDAIVSVEHTRECFPDGDIQWLKTDCHCLPLKFPEICAALVRELIETS